MNGAAGGYGVFCGRWLRRVLRTMSVRLRLVSKAFTSWFGKAGAPKARRRRHDAEIPGDRSARQSVSREQCEPRLKRRFKRRPVLRRQSNFLSNRRYLHEGFRIILCEREYEWAVIVPKGLCEDGVELGWSMSRSNE